jgi:hypothetical protein
MAAISSESVPSTTAMALRMSINFSCVINITRRFRPKHRVDFLP